MRLREFKKVIKGKKVFVFVKWQRDDGSYVEVQAKKFLEAIGADVPFSRDGLHDDTPMDARIGDCGNIFVD